MLHTPAKLDYCIGATHEAKHGGVPLTANTDCVFFDLGNLSKQHLDFKSDCTWPEVV